MRTLVIVAGVLIGGCGGTSRVASDVSTAALSSRQTGVVLMRIGAASGACRHVAVLLGTPEAVPGGVAYKRAQAIQVANVASVAEPAVAEVELPPGEYHVVGYRCTGADGKPHALTTSDAQGHFRSSWAAFEVAAGEIVNVGYLHFGASHVGRSAFGRPYRLEVKVTDWPLADIDRYRARRPELYAKMITRLMRVTLKPDAAPPTDTDCARLAELKAAGKVQALPQSCA